jgi:hypothetical protein
MFHQAEANICALRTFAGLGGGTLCCEISRRDAKNLPGVRVLPGPGLRDGSRRRDPVSASPFLEDSPLPAAHKWILLKKGPQLAADLGLTGYLRVHKSKNYLTLFSIWLILTMSAPKSLPSVPAFL